MATRPAVQGLPRRLLDVACRMRVGETMFRDDELVDEAAHALQALSAPEQAAQATGGTDRETLLTALRDRLPLNTDQRSMLYVLVQQAHPDRKPDGWAYRYPGPYGGLRFNEGQEVNGSKPSEAVPYFLGEPPAQQADARDAALTLARELNEMLWSQIPGPRGVWMDRLSPQIIRKSQELHAALSAMDASKKDVNSETR